MMNRGDRSYPTIEKELITALVRAKLIPTYCWDSPYAMRFVIASRTDKVIYVVCTTKKQANLLVLFDCDNALYI